MQISICNQLQKSLEKLVSGHHFGCVQFLSFTQHLIRLSDNKTVVKRHGLVFEV